MKSETKEVLLVWQGYNETAKGNVLEQENKIVVYLDREPHWKSTPQPTAEGQRLDKINYDWLQDQFDKEPNIVQDKNSYFAGYEKAMEAYAAQHHNKGECERVSKEKEEDFWFKEHEAFVTAMKIDGSKSVYDHLQTAFQWFKNRNHCPSPITKEQIIQALKSVSKTWVEDDGGHFQMLFEDAATAILNLIQGGDPKPESTNPFHSRSLNSCPFNYCDSNPKCVSICRYDTTLTEANEMLKNPATVEQAKAQVERLKGERYTCCDEGTCEECGAFIPHATGLCGECISKPSNH